MIDRDKHQTNEFKKDNTKSITVHGDKKLLLMDDDESYDDTELQEIIEAMVVETLSATENTKKGEEDNRTLWEEYIDEADFPKGFSIEEFKNISSFKKRVAYAKMHLERIAGGSSRVVFVADDNIVIKIALNRKGQAQNETEADISQISNYIVANVKDADYDNYLYLETERARKMKKSEWLKATGWKFDEWMAVLYNYFSHKRGYRLLVPEDFEDIEETELFNDLISVMGNFDLPASDIMRISSWGMVERGGKEHPILVDYGLTRSVYNDYYK